MDVAIRLPPLGWPWDAMLEAGRRMERADRALLVAGTAGDVMGKCAAELDRERAIADWYALKEELAQQWFAGLRAAVEIYGPGAVAVLFDGLPPAATVTEAMGAIEDRMDAAEDAVVNLEHGRACR